MEKEPTTFNKEQHFNDRLSDQKKKIEGELREIAVENNNRPGFWRAVSPEQAGDLALDGDNAEALETLNQRQETVDSLAKRLGEIQIAEKRIQEGKGNICIVCGEPIEEERREADPASVTCKEHREEEG